MVKIVKNPGNGRLNNLNDPVLNVLTSAVDGLNSQGKPQFYIREGIPLPVKWDTGRAPYTFWACSRKEKSLALSGI